MKHFNLKSLAFGAAIAGTLVAGNVYAEPDDHGLEEKNLCTLRWGGGRTLCYQGSGAASSFGTYNQANGGNGRVYLERTASGKYVIAGQGRFIAGIVDGQQVTPGTREEAIEFDVEGNINEGDHDLFFSHEGIYLVKGGGNNDIQGSATKPTDGWRFNNENLGDNRYKAQPDGAQKIVDDETGLRYSVLMFPFALKATDDIKIYTLNSDYEKDETIPEDAYVYERTSELGAGVPGLSIVQNTLDDNDWRLPISFTDGATGFQISEYLETPGSDGFATGFFSTPNVTADQNNFLLGVKDGVVGFYPDLTFTNNSNSGNYKQDQVNVAYIPADAKVPYYTVSYDKDKDIIIVKSASQRESLINQSVALVAELQALVANQGEDEGKYNITKDNVGTEGYTSAENVTLIRSLKDYAAADAEAYDAIETDDDLKAFTKRLQDLIVAVKATFVPYSLNLGSVEIVTLQYEGQDRYSGINGGGKWENPSDFGSPNGGNGRVALVQAEEGKYYIASQALFLKVTEEGKRVTAENKADATAFNVTRSTADGLTFVTEDGWYLTGSQFSPSKDAPAQDYKLNTFGNYANISANDGARELNGVYYSSMIFPFNIGNPDKEGYNTFILKKNGEEITAEKVDVVPAGVPFVYVAASKDDNARLPIPQEDQAYVESVQSEGNLLDGAFILRVEGEVKDSISKNSYTLSVVDGKVGYFLDGGFAENTPANCAYITKEAAEATGAAQIVLVYDAETATLTVNTDDELTAAIKGAIAKFKELNDVVTDATVNNKDRYTYELTEDDNNLLDGGYEEAAAYDGKDLEAVTALKDQFQALIDALKASRTPGLKDVNIVTLQWNKGRYTGLNGSTSWTNPGNGFGGPNGANGKIGIIKKENGYVIASQGVFYKVVETVGEDETVTYAPGDADNEADATQFTVTGTVEDGLTFEYNGQYLNDIQLKLTAEKPAQSYAVNSFDVATEHYAKVSEDLTQVGDVYVAAITVPFKVQKPEGDDFHTYVVTESEGTLKTEDVDVVPAGVPFIYVSPTNDGELKRLIIPQDDQEYAAVPSTEYALAGQYLASAVENAYVLAAAGDSIKFEKNEAWAGATNRAYIPNDVAEALEAIEFVLVDGELKAITEEIATGINEIPAVRVNTDVIYDLKGNRVSKAQKGVYIQNGKKIILK